MLSGLYRQDSVRVAPYTSSWGVGHGSARITLKSHNVSAKTTIAINQYLNTLIGLPL